MPLSDVRQTLNEILTVLDYMHWNTWCKTVLQKEYWVLQRVMTILLFPVDCIYVSFWLLHIFRTSEPRSHKLRWRQLLFREVYGKNKMKHDPLKVQLSAIKTRPSFLYRQALSDKFVTLWRNALQGLDFKLILSNTFS